MVEPYPTIINWREMYHVLLERLARIEEECARELERIEEDGGLTGFAERIRALARGAEDE